MNHKNKPTPPRIALILALAVGGCGPGSNTSNEDSYGSTLDFLKRHTEVVELTDSSGLARIIVAPAWQGRVMTSTDGGLQGMGNGWVNRDFIAAGQLKDQFNPFGGEDRLWIGPEGGRFSIFFPEGSTFDLANWQTPPPIDTEPFEVVSAEQDRVKVNKRFALKNYSGTVFDVEIDRTVRLLSRDAAFAALGVAPAEGISLVAYESVNRLRNAGPEAWSADTGLLSIWIMGMFTASPEATVVVPFNPGDESALGIRINTDYFGDIPPDRLMVGEDVAFFRGDGKYRSKIGVSRQRVRPVAGAYDSGRGVLTIVQFTFDPAATRFVNSQWKLEGDPFGGDVFNSYNDDGNLGAFYELESLSPAQELQPGEAVEHLHRTMHLRGDQAALDAVSRDVLGVGLSEIEAAWPSS